MLALTQAGLWPRLPAAVTSSLLALSPALLRTLTTSSGNNDADTLDRDKKYVDRLKLTCRAGKGGNGCVSFYQGASRGLHAVADGGSGGDGGNVVVRAVSNMKSLAGVQQLYKGEGGQHGTKQRQHGRAGRDSVVLVPVGTVVQRMREQPPSADGAGGAAEAQQRFTGQQQQQRQRDQQPQQQQAGEQEEELPEWIRRWHRPFSGKDYSSDEEAGEGGSEESSTAGAAAREPPARGAGGSGSGGTGGAASNLQQNQRQQQQYEMLADLTEEGQEVVVARGGAGGRGNAGIKARAHRPAPADSERGHPGETAHLLLELKLLADIGLVGLPNAGKSTLLRALTAATPRVGDYAFTTLAPQLGVLPPLATGDEPLVLADIPGLIRGAHENRGLGHNFLRHIERTRGIAYVLDCQPGTAGSDKPSSWEQLELLQAELAAYSPRLAALPAVVVANKVEMLRAPQRTLGALRRRTELEVVAVSAKERSMLLPAGKAAPSQSHMSSSLPTDSSGQRVAVRGGHAWMPGLAPLAAKLASLVGAQR